MHADNFVPPPFHPCSQTSSKRLTNAKSAKFLANVHKRGMVEDTQQQVRAYLAG